MLQDLLLLDIKDTSAETLAGRVSYFYLSPFLFSELTHKNISIYDDLENKIDMKILREKAALGFRAEKDNANLLQKIILFGSLPRTMRLSHMESISYLNNFIATYLDKDIKDIGVRVDIENFHLSFKYLTEYVGGLFNVSKLSSDLGVKRDSLYRYFQLLEKTLIIQTLSPLIFPKIKHIFKSKKLFFFDNGVVVRQRGYVNFEELERSHTQGVLFENYVFQNFFAKSLNDPAKPDFFYFRDYLDHEIDFIYKRADTIVPIETTYSYIIPKAKIRNFKHFFRLYQQARYGIIFYLGELQEIRVENKSIFALPYFLM